MGVREGRKEGRVLLHGFVRVMRSCRDIRPL